MAQPPRVGSPPVNVPTDADIISFCHEHQSLQAHLRATSRVVIREGIAYKYGRVTRQEVDNQRLAHRILDPTIVRVPLIYRYFTSEGIDYLAMKAVAVQAWGADHDRLDAIVHAVNHLHSFTRTSPGPALGGEYGGMLWPEDDPRSFSTREDLERYVNRRLSGTRQKMSFVDLPMVFTHGDLCSRNILCTAQEIWFLDWEFSGYYPRTTEIAVLQGDIKGSKEDYLLRQTL
ncbi:hypothetical protein LTR81_026425 [Elasticomyces elasticus]